MDFIIATAGTDAAVRKKFSNVVLFVDVPILLSMLFIETLFHPIITTSFYFFEAGVVSFQLIVGSFSVIALDMLIAEPKH